jgi:hypothetical protein
MTKTVSARGTSVGLAANLTVQHTDESTQQQGADDEVVVDYGVGC